MIKGRKRPNQIFPPAQSNLECNYIHIVVLNIINGNFGLVKS